MLGLHLEKNQILIKVRKKERILSFSLLKALSISLGIHLLFLSLFSIKTQKQEKALFLKPINVSVDLKSAKKNTSKGSSLSFNFLETQAEMKTHYMPKTNQIREKIKIEPLFDFTEIEIEYNDPD